MGSFSLIKSSTDTLCRKPHRMEGIISQRCLSVIPQPPAGPSEPAGHRHSRDGFGMAASHPHPRCCVCGIAAAVLSAPSEGGPACPSATPPACPPGREAPRSPGSRRAAGGQPVSAIQVAG